MKYLEIAQGSPRNRGFLVQYEKLSHYIKADEPLYRSFYTYDDTALKVVEETQSLKKFVGVRSVDKVLIDIDKADNSDRHTLNFLISTVFELEERGLSRKSMQAYFSGTGYHLVIPNSAFEFETSVRLPLIIKSTLKSMLPDIDTSIYSKLGIYRVAHTINNKSQLYKIPLTIDEVYNLEPEEIKELAKTPRLEYPYSELFADGELSEYVVTTPCPSEGNFKKVLEPTKIAPCVQSYLREGPISGTRHNIILRIISHFKRHGIPSEYSKAMIMHWNKDSLDATDLLEMVENSYNQNYRYGCNDEYLAARCQTRCIYFKHKDYNIDVKNAGDMQSELDERLTTNFDGRSIDLAKSFGLKDIDATIYPGELVTIFGPTGSNKTTLAQNLALGVDFKNDTVRKEWQIPTLFLSLELSAWYMHRRHLQIVTGLSKDEVNKDYKELFAQNSDLLNHLVIQTISPTLDQVKQKVRELQPAVVVVDYIDLMETPITIRGEYEKVKYISHGLSNMAVNSDLIVIQVSQVSRDYSRNEVLDLYAGKGSGAIENASRKVIGLNGQANSSKKALSVYKNTDGELFDVDLEWRPSFRMKCV